MSYFHNLDKIFDEGLKLSNFKIEGLIIQNRKNKKD
jgi:hypothetical protein